jgi:hypothetical protein
VGELGQINFNALPVWLVALAVIFRLTPGILREIGTLVPSLTAKGTAERASHNTRSAHEYDTEALAQSQQIKIQDRMLSILEQTLVNLWDDRAATLNALNEIRKELSHQSHIINRNTDVTTSAVALMSERAESLRRDG